MKRAWVLAAVAVVSMGLAGCSTTSPDVIQPGSAQRLSTVDDAVVLAVRDVVVEGSQSGAGAATGAVIGGVGGASVGGAREHIVVGVLGAVVGGVVGNAVERFGTREDAVELILQLSNGQRRSLVQAKGKQNFEPGDAVLLINTAGKLRVVKAPASNATPTTSVPAPAAAQ